MTIDPDEFRSVLGRFASGVTVVTALDDQGRDHGLTVSAFASLSLVPPLVLVCIDHSSSLHPALAVARNLAVNILAAYQHYRWRASLAHDKRPFNGLQDNDKWQAAMLASQRRDLQFWGV